VLVRDEAIDLENERVWNSDLAQREWELVREALTNAISLISTQSFSAEIASSFRAQAIVAVLLSFLLILIYIWARFGSVRYSFAAITALVHDVLIAIGLIALAEILYANVPFLVSIGLQPYKIDLALVAAILTIVGYSLNDTIVILDRIRENRGKLAYASEIIVNRSINQTLSRTIITSGTTLIALLVLFSSGGDALSSFTYALICGVLIGTYSSIAVAAPLAYTKRIPESARKFVRQTEQRLLEEAGQETDQETEPPQT
jgi:SecD/SecF fusion protein